MKNKKNVVIIIVAVMAGSLFFYFGRGPAYIEKNPDRAYKGNPEGEILIREYSDFACPACAAAEGMVEDLLKTYGDKIRFEYHHFPLTSIPSHRHSFKAAVASECANDQNKFWEYHALLFENQEAHAKDDLISYAEDLKLDTEDFKICLASNTKEKLVRKDISEANVAGVNSTPTFFMGSGPLHKAGKIADWRDLKKIIERDIAIRGLAIPVDEATSTKE